MDYSISYNEDGNFFYIKTDGVFDINRFSELAEELLSHKEWSPGANCLFDYRMTDFLHVSSTELARASSLHKQKNKIVGAGKSALIMKDVGNFGMGRMYQNTTECAVDTQFCIFSEFEEAQKWVSAS